MPIIPCCVCLRTCCRHCVDVLLAAVRELAGPDEPKLFSSAVLVANTLKVIQTLEQIGEQLQVRKGEGSVGSCVTFMGQLSSVYVGATTKHPAQPSSVNRMPTMCHMGVAVLASWAVRLCCKGNMQRNC
jgi:hypothetical protein